MFYTDKETEEVAYNLEREQIKKQSKSKAACSLKRNTIFGRRADLV
jgi:hypothetical protein